jgi:signal peptidase I
MTKKNTLPPKTSTEVQPAPESKPVEETPFEAVASICTVLVVGLFILTFLCQNFVIPSGSMEKTLLVGDHLVVDRITLAPPTSWMPLVRYREPMRGDIVVFLKPGEPDMILVKRLVGIPGDRIHLRNGIVIVNGVAQSAPHAQPTTFENHSDFLDEFPAVPPSVDMNATETWAVDAPNYIKDGDLVIPPGKYFMMGDNRHNSLDSPAVQLLVVQDAGRPVRADGPGQQSGLDDPRGGSLPDRDTLESNAAHDTVSPVH